jgi:phosphate transport system substrate-binding protein
MKILSSFGVFKVFLFFLTAIDLTSCRQPDRNSLSETTPTAGLLKVYYDEGLALHVKNQAYTFEALYSNVRIELHRSSEAEAVEALYKDSCELIVISRDLGTEERKAFASRQYHPVFSKIALSGIALITHSATPIKTITLEGIKTILSGSAIKDSNGTEFIPRVLFDRDNSSVLHYMMDSVLKSKKLGNNCSNLDSTLSAIKYVKEHPGVIAFIDFAWLSDIDDSLYRSCSETLQFIPVSADGKKFELPSPTTFKLGTYPFTRTVYAIKKIGEFTLAKGFESFMAGPKGQLTFLKQGLLPTRQAERQISVSQE